MYVVGADGSARSDAALRWAREQARRHGCGLLVVRVWPGAAAHVRDTAEIRERVAREQAALDASVARALAGVAAPPMVARELRAGAPARELLLAADAVDAAAVVVGRSGLGGIQGALLGSVSRRCVTDAARPVVVVPPAGPVAPTGRVAVGIADDADGLAAVEWAAAEAAVRHATLVAVRAYEGVAFADPAVTEDCERQLAERVLEKAAPGVPVEHVLADGPAGPALLRAAAGADLLVVGAHAPGPLAAVLPTTAVRCAEEAAAPVVVVRAR